MSVLIKYLRHYLNCLGRIKRLQICSTFLQTGSSFTTTFWMESSFVRDRNCIEFQGVVGVAPLVGLRIKPTKRAMTNPLLSSPPHSVSLTSAYYNSCVIHRKSLEIVIAGFPLMLSINVSKLVVNFFHQWFFSSAGSSSSQFRWNISCAAAIRYLPCVWHKT